MNKNLISVFIKEQKKYSKKTLIKLFESNDIEILSLLTSLNGYGILKVVKKRRTQNLKSSVINEEIKSSSIGSEEEYYVFNFVGIVMLGNRILKCYPKYLHNKLQPKQELSQILEVLDKYNATEQIITIFDEDDEDKSFNLLAVMLYILKDYHEYGSYNNNQNIIESNGSGEILWEKTINDTFPLMQKNKPYYFDLYTQDKRENDHDYFKRLHNAIVSLCSRELRRTGLEELFGLLNADISDEELDDFGDYEEILSNIDKEINLQYNTRKLNLLKLLYLYISQDSHLTDKANFSFYGTTNFNLVWERVCAEVLDNKLYVKLQDLPIKFESVDERVRLIDLIEKPQWNGKGDIFSIRANETLIPDIISINKIDDSAYSFILFDAKYYNLILQENKLIGNPGVGDVTKQYLYQLAYQKILLQSNIHSVKNCFLMPTEEDKVINAGTVNMSILEDLGLERIQLRKLPACYMYDMYINSKKICIESLKL